MVEGIAYDAKGIGEIANIPSREELLSKFLGSIQSPITNFARVINQLAEKGGAVVGVNTFTLDGDKTAISEAKEILEKKKASYRNIWFASDSEAGKFTSGIYSYPTTYVVDRNGNIVGEPIVGAITGKKQAEKLQELIDQAIESGK